MRPEVWVAILAVIAGGGFWAYMGTRSGQKLGLYDSMYNQMQEDRDAQDRRMASLESQLAAMRVRLTDVEDRADHYDAEVRALRRGISDGTIPPLPPRPAFRGAP